MQDKDKILLLVSVGVYNLNPSKAVEKVNELRAYFESQFDDSYKVLCYTNDCNQRIDIRLYNPNKEEQDRIVQLNEEGSIDALRPI